MIARLRGWIRTVSGRRRFEADMREEMRTHIALHARTLERDGLSPSEAMRRAHAAFGSVESLKDDARDALGLRLLDELRADVRYAWRTLRSAPSYTAVAVITLALGIGATTTMFSVIHGVLLSPLPYANPERLVQIATYPNGAFAMYERSPSYESVGAYSWAGELNLVSDGTPERIRGRSVSAGFFRTLGVTAPLGRTFLEGEDRPGAPMVAVISDGLWRRRFGADSSVIGRVVSVDGRPREIVGVAPRGFNFPVAGTELWVPIVFDQTRPIPLWNSTTTFIGRLAPGVTLARADAEHRAQIPEVRAGFPWTMPASFGTGAENHVQSLREVMTAGVRDRLLLLFGAVALVLLVACVNVANLNLTRVTSRAQEFRLREVLGGSRARIGRQLLVEQLVLCGAGAALGILVAFVGTPLVVRWLPPDTARLDDVTISGAVLAFTTAAALIAALFTALAPLVRLARRPVALAALGARGNSGGPGRSRLASTLVIAEVAMAAMLVVGAGVMLRSLDARMAADPGVRTDAVISAKIALDPARCTQREIAPGQWELPAACRPFFQTLEDRLRTLPGVSRFALSARLPLEDRGGGMAMHVEDHPLPPTEPAHWLEQRVVTPEYFALLGIAIEDGRAIAAEDTRASPPVVVISRAVANRYWPGASPIGKRIKPVWLPAWATVVGVAADVAPADGATAAALEFYVPLAQEPREEFYVLAETPGGGATFESALRTVVHETDPTVPVSRVRTLAAVRSATTASPRVTSTLLAGFALLALVLGAVGVYGVLSYGVAQQRREIGIRMAIGASTGSVRSMVLGRAARLLAGGVAAGLAGAWFAVALLDRFVYGIRARDPVAFGATVAVFLVVGFVAAYLPARRASRVEPTLVMREG